MSLVSVYLAQLFTHVFFCYPLFTVICVYGCRVIYFKIYTNSGVPKTCIMCVAIFLPGVFFNLLQLEETGQEKVTSSMVCERQHISDISSFMLLLFVCKTVTPLVFLAIQFVLSDEFSHLRPEQRLALLHVSSGKHHTHYRSQLLFWKWLSDKVVVQKSFC